MSDAGLKGSTVFHNLTPAQLYEKARCPPGAGVNTAVHGAAASSRCFLWGLHQLPAS